MLSSAFAHTDIFHNGAFTLLCAALISSLLSPLPGTTLAGNLFGAALFASGQSSTPTGTMAGQIILQDFLKLRIPVGGSAFSRGRWRSRR
jgi:Mn2+/Fe2+ NRAMP family transporter